MKCIYMSMTLLVLILSSLGVNGQSVSKEWLKHGVNRYDLLIADKYARILKDGVQGVINIEGDTILKMVYKGVIYNPLGFFKVSDRQGLFGLFDSRGNEKLPIKFDFIIILDDGIQAVIDNQITYYNLSGAKKDHPIYSKYQIDAFSKKFLVASIDGLKWGVMDKSGQWVVVPQFRSIDVSNPNFLIGKSTNSYRIFNSDAREILSRKGFPNAKSFSKYIFASDETIGLFKTYDLQGKLIPEIVPFNSLTTIDNHIKLQYREIQKLYNENLELLVEGQNITFIDEYKVNMGIEKQPIMYCGSYNKMALFVNFIQKTEYIYNSFGKEGNLIIGSHSSGTDIFDLARKLIRSFKINVAISINGSKGYSTYNVKQDSLYLYEKNKYYAVQSCNYINEINGEYFHTSKDNGKYDLYNLNGQILLNDVDYVKKCVDNLYLYKSNDLCGWINQKVHIKPKYDELDLVGNATLLCSKKGTWQLSSIEGNSINKLTYKRKKNLKKGILLEDSEGTYSYFRFEDDTFLETSKISAALTDIGNGNLLFKDKSNKWKMYNELTKEFYEYNFDTVSIVNQILVTEQGKFRHNYETNSLEKISGQIISDRNGRQIEKINDAYYVKLNEVGRAKKTIVKKFECDTLELSAYYIKTYKNGRQSLYSNTLDSFIINNVDKVVFAESFSNHLSINKDSFSIFSEYEKVKTIEGNSPMVEIGNRIISFNENNVKYIYDVNLDTILEKKYDLYKGYSNGSYSVERNLKYGRVDSRHNEFITPRFNSIEVVQDQYLLGKIARKSCLLDLKGRELIPLDEYESNFTFSRGLIYVKKGRHYGVFNSVESKWYPASKYQDIKDCNIRLGSYGDIFKFRENGLYGLMDNKCNVILTAIYNEIRQIKENLHLYNNDSIRKLFVKENYIHPKQFLEIAEHNDYWVGSTIDSIFVYRDKLEVCKFKGKLSTFVESKGLIIFTDIQSNLVGMFDYKLKKEVVPPSYNWIVDDEKENLIAEDSKSNFCLINSKGIVIYRDKLDKFNILDHIGIKIVKVDKCGFIDFHGRELAPTIYDDFESYKLVGNSTLSLKRGSTIDVYSRKFELLFSGVFDYVGQFSHGVAPVRKGVNWGYVDVYGKVVIHLKYDYCSAFNTGEKAVVFVNKEYAIINLKGKNTNLDYGEEVKFNSDEAAKLKFDSGNYNKENYNSLNCSESEFGTRFILSCRPKEIFKYGVYDIFYNEIIPPLYDRLQPINRSANIIYALDGKFGIMDAKGVMITKPIYDNLTPERVGTLKASKDGHSFLIDLNGKVIE